MYYIFHRITFYFSLQRGAADKFRGHDLRHFKEITDNPDMVIDLLRGHAEAKYRAFIS